MNRYSLLGALLAMLVILTAQAQIHDEGPGESLIYGTADIEWQEGPGSFEEGSEFSVLEGDPSQEGLFILRIRMPDGFEIAPHTHPNVERVTVVSGTFELGSGEVRGTGEVHTLEAGSYFSMPPGMAHYATARGETVIQLSTIGPWAINYVNPEDDPRD